MFGLTKGILEYAGMGPRRWLINHPTKGPRSIWGLFTDILSNFDHVRIHVGEDHIALRSRDKYENLGHRLNKDQVEEFINGEEIIDEYLNKLLAYLTMTLLSLNGRPVRLQANYSQFYLISEDFFQHLKKIGRESLVGLYKDEYGFCRLDHKRQKNVCKKGTEFQCIFMTSLFETAPKSKNLMETALCGKFNQKFFEEEMTEFKSGNLGSMTVGACSPPRGFEI